MRGDAKRIQIDPTDTTADHSGSRAESNEARLETREVRLTKWDSYLFTQGVVIFAFEDLMPTKDRMAMIRQAINWADASVDVGVIAK